MTLCIAEGFDLGDSTYAYAGNGATVAGRFGGRALNVSTSMTTLTLPTPASVDEFWTGCAFQPKSSGSTSLEFVSDGGATPQLTVQFNSSLSWTVRRGDRNSASILGSIAGASDALWHHFRMHAKIHDTLGFFDLYLDGSPIPIWSFTGDTRNGGTSPNITHINIIMSTGGTGSGKIDDLWLLDTAGAAPYNDDPGELVVTTLLPNGNGASSVLLGSDGNSTDNYLLVDEGPFNLADYAGSAVVGDKDTYTLSDMPVGTYDILSAQEITVAFKSDAGGKSGRSILRSGGTDYPGATVGLATTPSASAPRGTMRTVDPATGVAWTIAGLDALEAGFEVMS